VVQKWVRPIKNGVYDIKKFGFQCYDRCRYFAPKNYEKSKLENFDDLQELNIKERLLRNIKKMENREKELFSVFHQYKGKNLIESSN